MPIWFNKLHNTQYTTTYNISSPPYRTIYNKTIEVDRFIAVVFVEAETPQEQEGFFSSVPANQSNHLELCEKNITMKVLEFNFTVFTIGIPKSLRSLSSICLSAVMSTWILSHKIQELKMDLLFPFLLLRLLENMLITEKPIRNTWSEQNLPLRLGRESHISPTQGRATNQIRYEVHRPDREKERHTWLY